MSKVKQLEEQLKTEQEKLANLNLQTEVALHKMNRQLQEDFLGYTAGWGDYINPYDQLFDGERMLIPFNIRYDYRSKQYLYLSEGQLDLFRAFARYLTENNHFVNGIFDGLTNFVVKKGFKYVVQPKRNRTPGKELLDTAQEIIDEFLDANDWSHREANCFLRSRRDGEFFLRLYPQDDGITRVRQVEPEFVRNPNGSIEFNFGILTPIDDREHVQKYYVTYSGNVGEGEEVDPEEIIHVKVNCDIGVKRGISDLFSCHELVENCRKLLKAEQIGETVRTSIAYIREFAQANLQTIQTMQQSETDFRVPVIQQQGSFRQLPSHKITPGEVPNIPEGLRFVNPPSYTGQGDSLLKAGLEALAQKFQAPSWMFTGEGSSSSYASSLTEESPFSRRIECLQHFYATHFDRLMTRVLEIAVAQERLPENALDSLDIQVVTPSVVVRQKKEQTERHIMLHDQKVLSKRTMSSLEDVDYEHEQALFKQDEPEFVVQQVKPDIPNTDQQPQSDVKRKAGDYKN